MFFNAGQGRPLVAAGPFAVFVDNDSGEFSVREIQSLLPLVELESHEQSKRLLLLSSREKGWKLPRFRVNLKYSEDGLYERGGFSVYGEDGMLARIYFDTQGAGVFDKMYVYENDTPMVYRLNNFSWELCPYPELLQDVEDTDSEVENGDLLKQ